MEEVDHWGRALGFHRPALLPVYPLSIHCHLSHRKDFAFYSLSFFVIYLLCMC